MNTLNNLDFARVAITARLREQSNANVRDDADHRRDCDHAAAMTDIDREANRARLQSLADQHLADKRNLPPPESCCARDARINEGFDEGEVTDDEITEWGAGVGLDKTALVARLRKYVADADAEAMVPA